MDKETFQKLLSTALQKGASDVHLQAGAQPLLRMNGELYDLKYRMLTPEDTHHIVAEILSQSVFSRDINDISDLDISYGIEGQGRFRANIFRQRGAFGIVLRVIPIAIRSFAELNLPPVLSKIANLRRGLVLVVGSTGNGKSTTLASIVECINNSRRAHIVTVEDPIEFLFKNKKAVICQREVGNDTTSFTKATIAAMRQDPDVIYIGEMREVETVDVALKAAETGHLVISSLHTMDCVNAVNRLVGFYPSAQEQSVRKRISDCLIAVVALRLLPRKGGVGRIPAVEVLRVTRTIQDCIRDGEKTSEIQSYMEKGAEMYEMQTFDADILRLVKEGLIDMEIAKVSTSKPDELERALMLEG